MAVLEAGSEHTGILRAPAVYLCSLLFQEAFLGEESLQLVRILISVSLGRQLPTGSLPVMDAHTACEPNVVAPIPWHSLRFRNWLFLGFWSLNNDSQN